MRPDVITHASEVHHLAFDFVIGGALGCGKDRGAGGGRANALPEAEDAGVSHDLADYGRLAHTWGMRCIEYVMYT